VPIPHRIVVFSFSSPEEALRFIESVNQFVKTANIIVELKGGRDVRIRIYGGRDSTQQTLESLKRLASSIKKSPGKPTTTPLNWLVRQLSHRTAFPINVLVDALRLMGYRAGLFKGSLVTNASETAVIGTAEKIAAVYRDLRNSNVSPQAKRIISLYVAATGVTTKEAIKKLADEKLVNVVEGRVTAGMDYENAFKKLSETLQKGG